MNRNVKLLISFLITLLTCSYSFALDFKIKKTKNPMINYNEWIPQQEWPSVIDGVHLYFPQTTTLSSDTVAVVKDHIVIPELSAKQYFIAALVFATENFDKEAGEEVIAIDYSSFEFDILLKTSRGTNNNETSYTRVMSFKAKDEGLDFTVGEIDCRYREKGIVPRTLRLEKLHPEINKRHAELVREFVDVNSDYIDRLHVYIDSRKDIESSYYSVLSKGGPIEVGMNMDEVTILVGPPFDKRTSGNKTRWIYYNNEVIIFVDGIVSKIVK